MKVGKSAQLTGGISVAVGKVVPVAAAAHGPGEIAGSAASVEIRVTNSTSAAFDLNSLVVNASYGGGTPATPNESDPAVPLAGPLKPGATAVGVYVFTLPKEKIPELKVDVSSGLTSDVAVFTQ